MQSAQIKTDIGNETLQTTKKNLKGAINEVFQFVNEEKKSIAAAVTNKGVPASPSDTFPTLASKIGQIETGYSVGDKISESNIEFQISDEWNIIVNRLANSIKIDEEGNILIGSNDNSLRKLSKDGTEIWQLTDYESSVLSIDIDSDGNILTTGLYSAIRKVSPKGVEIWRHKSHEENVNAVSVDSENNAYFGGGRNSDFSVKKVDSQGKLVWTYKEYPYIIYTICVSEDDNIYVGGGKTSSSYYAIVQKLDTNGAEMGYFTADTTINSIASYTSSDDGDVIYYNDGKILKKLYQVRLRV